MTAPADGPSGDSALVLADSTARILNQNDARPRDLHELESLGPYDAHCTQFSGAIWFPMVYDFSDEEHQTYPPVPQTLLRRHPGSGRMGLFLASHAGRVFGMPEDEGKALLQQLIDHATQRQFVYTHRWRVHDLVMWDNRCTMHRGKGYDDLRWPRDMQRATTSDVAPTCQQEGIAVPAAA